MNYGVIALIVATRPRRHSGLECPVRDLCLDRGGLGLGLAEELFDGDQVARVQRQSRTSVAVLHAA